MAHECVSPGILPSYCRAVCDYSNLYWCWYLSSSILQNQGRIKPHAAIFLTLPYHCTKYETPNAKGPEVILQRKFLIGNEILFFKNSRLQHLKWFSTSLSYLHFLLFYWKGLWWATTQLAQYNQHSNIPGRKREKRKHFFYRQNCIQSERV